MNMRRPPRVVVVQPWIRTGLDGYKTVDALLICNSAAGSGEVGIDWRRMLVLDMQVPSRGICLPDLDERVRNRPSIAVENAPRHNDSLTQRFSRMLPGQVVIVSPNALVAIDRPGDLRQRVRQKDQRFARRPQHRGAIGFMQQRRL